MCGIFGIFGYKGSYIQILESANFVMRRRGPDGSGTWFDDAKAIGLSHVRLAILDTSNAGSQPMISTNGRYIMIYNGEIYNYRELKKELEDLGETFLGSSDSEVFLSLFSRYGDSCFSRLNGIFAAAFWDCELEILTLVRDPMGVKPLYYSQSPGNKFSFTSELKALLRNGLIHPKLNPQAVLAHLGYLWSPGPDTIIQDIKKLMPGYFMKVKAGKIQSFQQYHNWSAMLLEGDSSTSAADWALRVASSVKSAVEKQMVSDVPLGAFLSGGLDSSAVALFGQHYLNSKSPGSANRLQCFSIDVGESPFSAEGFSDDLPYARKVAEHIGVDLHVVRVGSEMMNRLSEMIYFLDEPCSDPAALNTLFITEFARSFGIKVLLSGAGGDDIFTGYRRHFALKQERWWGFLPESARKVLRIGAEHLPTSTSTGRRIAKAFQYADKDKDHRLVSYFLWMDPRRALELLTPDFRSELNEESMYAPLLKTLHYAPAEFDSISKILFLERKHFLADHNLNYTDKMAMAAGVEVRVPLLDLDLVSLAGIIPSSFKQNGVTGKWIFKKAMEPYLPHEVIYRPKTGFGVPLRQWMQGILRPLVDDVLSRSSLLNRGLFDPKAVDALVSADRIGRVDATYTIFGIICLELWCRQFIDGNFSVDPFIEVIH
ncbi:asparagine synthase (glutamine-hydrolyzing) [Polynucleobacter sp. HIN7]|uniref:asparagine synthase (glutamine-hydrolyzing) n=1 Tax=Polynucleobacter sp. HIN7 TaxID=3047866 RepID=UPI002572CF3E|nr:asparagine synthase (glutamine-hydrolyzing) [Polynucleobacter sp. HIN7]BEI36604.1 asparagine synthase (glutamine-hydrolyzing) [Polynucleobacter sp. HIN7]